MRLKYFIPIFLVIIFAVSTVSAVAVDVDNVTKFNKVYNETEEIQQYEEYVSNTNNNNTTSVSPATPNSSANILVVIDSSIANKVNKSTFRYIDRLRDEGYSVTSYIFSGSNETVLRSVFANTPQLEGATLIGDIPAPYCDVAGNVYNRKDIAYPCDLYYMDIDGNWTDTDRDQRYELHQAGEGDTKPEIWVGRLYTSSLTRLAPNETEVITNYINKTLRYKNGNLQLQERALCYVDDDWAYNNWCRTFSNLYHNTTSVRNYTETIDKDYESRLDENYEFIHVMAHSNTQRHAWFINNGYQGSTWNREIESIHPLPKASFYQNFNCYVGKYTANNYMAGYYIFNNSYGLASVASSKSGSMLNFAEFYNLLAEGKTYGQAFKEWWISQHPYSDGEQFWYYGLTIIGDPTLRPSQKIVSDVESSTGNFWINWSWDDPLYNYNHTEVQVDDESRINTSTGYYNYTNCSPHATKEIALRVIDSEGNKHNFVNQSTTIPNNPVSITNVSSRYDIAEGDNLSIDANYIDLDNDTAVFYDNSSKWKVNTSTGRINWSTDENDNDTYKWTIVAMDNHRSIDKVNFTVYVTDINPTPPSNLVNTTGTFWINWSWSPGSNVDQYEVWINGSWVKNTTKTDYKQNYSGFVTKEIAVRGYNKTLKTYSRFVNQTTSLRPLKITGVSAHYSLEETDTLQVDANATDSVDTNFTFATNATEGTFSNETGELMWDTERGDEGNYRWNITVTSGYSQDRVNFTITVNEREVEHHGGGGGGGFIASTSPYTDEELQRFVSCLNGSGVTIYGSIGTYTTRLIGKLGGETIIKPIYVDCWGKSEELCSEKGIHSYPTLIVDGKKYDEWPVTYRNLSQISGCPLPGKTVTPTPVSSKEEPVKVNNQTIVLPNRTATVTPTKPTHYLPGTPETLTPTVNVTETPTPTPTPKEESPGFKAMFALMGLLAVAYLLRR